MRFLPAGILLVLAGLAGWWAQAARDDAGILPSPGRVPLGGFEPFAVDVLYLRANELIEEQRLPEAITAVRLVTELQPRVPEGWATLGHTIAWRNSESSGDPEEQWKYVREALQIFDRGILFNPDSYLLRFELGILLLQRLAVREDILSIAEREMSVHPIALALSSFKEAARIQPDSIWPIRGMAESARLLGLRLLEKGDHNGAKEALREALGRFEQLIERSEAEVAERRVGEIKATLEDLSGR